MVHVRSSSFLFQCCVNLVAENVEVLLHLFIVVLLDVAFNVFDCQSFVLVRKWMIINTLLGLILIE